jgi:SecD/SecF fusion protein
VSDRREGGDWNVFVATPSAQRAQTRRPRGSLVWRSLLTLLVLAAAVAAVLLQPVRLGLDLRGGTQVVLEARSVADRPLDDDTLDRTLEVLRRRVDVLGVAEPTLQRSGDARIIVELPGVTDPDEAVAVIGRTAQLTFHTVEGVAEVSELAETDDQADRVDVTDGAVLADDAGVPLRLGSVALAGDDVRNAGIALGQGVAGRFDVTVEFRGEGQEAWQRLTADAACAPPGDPQRRVAIVLDGEIISSPQVVEDVVCGQGIAGGSTSITGDFTQEEAEELSLLIRGGALPVPIDVVEQRTIGPSLGEAAIEASILAALIGVTITLLFMVFAYRLLGLVAGLGLLLYGLLSYAALVGIGATLTLPGIAGFVLAVGMAVDANVLVFERAKEEHTAGRSARSAITTGFERALTAVVDSNVTTVIAAVLLLFFASGAVRGFGVTLTIGVAVSMFTALVITRVVVDWLVRSPRLAGRPEVLGLTAWRQVRTWLDEHRPDLMARSRRWLSISTMAVVLALAGIAVQGLNWGLEFTGGRLLEYRTTDPVDIDQLRSELAQAGLDGLVAQTSGEGQVALRTAALTDVERDQVRLTIESVAGSAEVVRDEFIGPTIGSELRRNALIALGIALTGQLLYLAVRFRWTYGAAAVAGMAHDVAILIGVFAWLGKPIDGIFLAALLTVIGYSINDTVVIFDRVREQRAAEPKRKLTQITNEALLQTLPRTVNTGMGALFILIALYVLGGDTLSDFALALIIGTAVGMYSSLLVASPIFLTLERWRPSHNTPVRPRPSSRPRKDRAVV